MMNCTLRKISEEDVTQLQVISRSTFRETFEDHNTEEDLNKYLDEQLSIKSLLEELKNPNSAFYFAYENERIVGYLKLNWTSAQTELIDEAAFEIERIYILKEFFGTGLGQFLLNNAITIGKAKKPTYIWLGVWEKNTRAIRFYEKNGFKVFSSHLFTLGNDIQTDLLMKLDITN
ncbi:N-acetyltransferase [Sediminibacterium sp.]|uniref:GNAT family N-acetyltransferase n=1 Tax=Sediminibacterium sp. TaxID=1917865 RepID=UPI002730F82F|nr:N-acetyltransferase [Sediminibacterium sp.]MDP2419861.1 N-acetyltransferase [Sediminibacterium sp.]